MNCFSSKFLVIFGLVSSSFLVLSCGSSNLVWSTSNGIVTYNRHTGQFELMWDTSMANQKAKSDTVWICPEDSSRWVKVDTVRR